MTFVELAESGKKVGHTSLILRTLLQKFMYASINIFTLIKIFEMRLSQIVLIAENAHLEICIIMS